MIRSWSIRGAEGQPIVGDTHVPDGASRGVIIICHGFKGYKDYGMFPRIAHECTRRGRLIAHRFNFSHSGMTSNTTTFERPDLFERDTWGKQVFDLTAVLAAIARGELEGHGRPLFVLGHSRGGVTALLTVGRLTYLKTFSDIGGKCPKSGDGERAHGGPVLLPIAGVITLAAPSFCNPFSPNEQRTLLQQGWIESPSSRTGQNLRVGRIFLQEQLDDPAAHDVLAHVARIACPALIIHGEDDLTVPVQCAEQIARAAGDRAMLRVIPGGDHVFNTPNPLPDDQPSSGQLVQVNEEVVRFTTAIMMENAERSGRHWRSGPTVS